MTCVVFKDGILAADTQMTLGDGSKVRVRKLKRLPDGSLFAGAGDAKPIDQVQEWAEKGFSTKKPRLTPGALVDCLVIRPNGDVWLIEKDLRPEQIMEPFYAIGTGGPYAMGAMAASKKLSAAGAIKIAAKFDSGTSEPIETLSLEVKQ